MTTPLSNRLDGVGAAGATTGQQALVPVVTTRSPASSDILGRFGPYKLGQKWVNATAGTDFTLVKLTSSNGSVTATWSQDGAASGAIFTVTTDDLTAVTPVSGNINLAGTANQVITSGSGATATIALTGPYTPATYTAHGVLIGEGTSSIVATTAGSTGQVLIGSTGANPAFGALGLNSGLTVHGVLLGENNSAIAATTAGSNGQVFLGSTGADPAFGTLTTSTGVAFTTGAAALAIDLKQGGFKINAASTGATIAVQNSYTITQAGQTSFALPAAATVGDMFLIAAAQTNTSGWIITQGASQEIWLNTSHTTNGATGTLAGAKSTSVVLMCTVANVEFVVVGGTGATGLTFA